MDFEKLYKICLTTLFWGIFHQPILIMFMRASLSIYNITQHHVFSKKYSKTEHINVKSMECGKAVLHTHHK